MQPNDAYGSYPTGEDASAGGTGTVTGERQFVDYISDIGDTVSSGAGRAAEFIRGRPLLIGSLVAGVTGAFVGSRIARMIVMRRRKTAYERTMETAAVIVATIGTLLSSESTRRAMDRLADAGKNISGPVQGLRASVAGGLPMAGRPRADRPSVIRQIGYAVSLIPVSLAVIRNPLARGFGFRLLARRIRRK